MAFSIEQLPESWLLRFVEFLPNHIKLSLRQSSLGMLQLIDSHPSSKLTWQLPNTVIKWRGVHVSFFSNGDELMQVNARRSRAAAELCAANVVHLDICQAWPDLKLEFSPIAESFQQAGTTMFPKLQRVTARVDQHRELTFIVEGSPPGSIQSLSMWCCGECVVRGEPGSQHKGMCVPYIGHGRHGLDTVTEQHLTSVQHIDLLGRHHHFGQTDPELERLAPEDGLEVPLESYRTGPWLQHLTALQSLLCPELYDIDAQAVQEGLGSCLTPLQQLTRLQLSGMEGGIEFDGATRLDLQGLPALQSLSIQTLHECIIDTQGLSGLVRCSNLTLLELSGGLDDFDVQVLSELVNLQDLTLSSNRAFTSDDFQPLTACRTLTSLTTDSFLLNAVASTAASALAAAAPDTSAPSAANADPSAAASGPASGSSGSAQQRAHAAPARSWCLQSLKRLSIGNVGLVEYLAPVATFAPSLTELQDTYWEGYGSKPNASEGAADADALIGLQQLHVLDLDLYTLDRHARHLPGLTGLSTMQELRLEMVGEFLKDSISLQEGLPRMPHLTKLLMYTKENALASDWVSRYNCAEDLMLWQQQSQLKMLTIRGSCRLGGFLVDAAICAQLPVKLPALRCVCIEQCPDLVADMVEQLVHVQPAPVVKVLGCKQLTERQCCTLSSESVVVEYI